MYINAANQPATEETVSNSRDYFLKRLAMCLADQQIHKIGKTAGEGDKMVSNPFTTE